MGILRRNSTGKLNQILGLLRSIDISLRAIQISTDRQTQLLELELKLKTIESKVDEVVDFTKARTVAPWKEDTGTGQYNPPPGNNWSID